MNKRTDIHRPSAINPREYEFVAYDYIGPGASDWQFLSAEKAAFRTHMARTGGKFSGHDHGGSCHICGATAFYIAKFYHPKTNTYIVTGEDCAEKMHMGNPAAFRTFRDKVHAGLEAYKGKKKAEKILASRGLGAAWAMYLNPPAREDGKALPFEESTILDIVGKTVRYGSIFDSQAKLVEKCLAAIPQRAAKEAARKAENDAALPVPNSDKRMVIEGKVLSTREPQAFGPFPAWKMLVQHKDGWKVWGSIPGSICNGGQGVRRGDMVRFEALVTRSDKDEKFGFFSRPTKAEVLEVANA